MEFNYRIDVLEELARHGVAPTPVTPPEIVREFVNDLYLYEIRALRCRFRAGELPKSDYAGQVEALRNRYPVLSLPLRYWTAQGA
jgi:hypothetical protein